MPQVALTCTQIWWTTEVGIAFARLEEGYESAMKDYYKKQVAQLKTLITMLVGELSKGDRQKIMTICTIDVHARDVVAKMIAQKVGPEGPEIFLFVKVAAMESDLGLLHHTHRTERGSWWLLLPFKPPPSGRYIDDP